jgi:imidazolonepropionase-like amidohydrolase
MFSAAEPRGIVGEAALKSIPVQAHAHGAEGAHAAVKAGVRSIEHGTYLSDETLKLMAAQGTFFVPTADIVSDLAEAGGDYDDAALQRRGQMMLPVLKAAIGRAKEFGVKISAGSDTSYGPRSVTTLAREGRRAVGAGLTPLEGPASRDGAERGTVSAREADWPARAGLRGRCAGGGREPVAEYPCVASTP